MFKGHMFKKHRLKIAVVVSLLIHFLVVGVVSLNEKHAPDKHQYVDIQMLENQLQKNKKLDEVKPDGQIVEQNEKALNDEKPDDAKFLSKNNQRVEKQTVALNSGKFKNATEQGKPSEQISENSKSENAQTLEKSELKPDHVKQSKSNEEKTDLKNRKILTSEFGEHVAPSLADLKPSFKPNPSVFVGGENSGSDASATDDHIKDVATGMQTLLSTREFIYYTYYNRIKDRLRQYWEPKIKEKVGKILRQGRTIASTSEKITKIVIILNEKGTLERIQVVGPSGLEDLDDAAVEAFRAAAPFPNPPKGIIEGDGKIRIRWDFILEA
jgi:TonB family protein